MKQNYKPIDFAIRQSSQYSSYYTIETYRPKTNAFGYTKFIQMDNEHPINKKEMKILADYIYKFIGENERR